MATMNQEEIFKALTALKETPQWKKMKSSFASVGYVSDVKTVKSEKLTFKAYTDKNGKSGYKVDKQGRKTEEVYPLGIRKEQGLRVMLGLNHSYEKKMQNATGDSTFKAGSMAGELKYLDGWENLVIVNPKTGDYELRTYPQIRDGKVVKFETHYYDNKTNKEVKYEDFKRFLSSYKEDDQGNEIKEELAIVEVRNLKLSGITFLNAFGEQL